MQCNLPQTPCGDVIERPLPLQSGEGPFHGLPLLRQSLAFRRGKQRTPLLFEAFVRGTAPIGIPAPQSRPSRRRYEALSQ